MNTKNLRYGMRFIPDKPYLKICYRLKTHKKLDLKNPKTFNEKIQWLKLYNRKPEYTIMVDKYRVREYISEKIGKEYLIPLVGGPYASVEEIDFDTLPEQFVLKCNHDSGSVVICKDKKTFDFESAKRKLDYCLKHNFWYLGREWPYKDVKPCIIAERYMADESGSELKDYKVFNFNGEPEIIQVDFGRFKEHKRNLYDTGWKYIEAAIEYPTDPEVNIDRPKQLEQMIKLARFLSKDIPFLRTDFYSIEDKLYFGELTFFHESGFGKFEPEKYEELLGEKINIERIFAGGVMLLGTGYVLLLRQSELLHKQEAELKDYKFMCFNGRVKCSLVCNGRFSDSGLRCTFYNRDWKRMPFELHDKSSSIEMDKPRNYDEMIILAERLSEDLPFVRVDFYENNGKVYFGELTFYPGSGFGEFRPDEWDKKLGEWINI